MFIIHKDEGESMEYENENQIAVIGMSGRFPQAESIDKLWQNLLEGKECIQHFSKEELEECGIPREELEAENYVGAKGIIEDANSFDVKFFDYTAKEAMIMDPQARVFLEEAWKAIEDSGNAISQLKGRASVYAGAGMNTYLLRGMQRGVLQQYDDFDIMMGSDKDLLATRVAYKLNLTGPSLTVQSTCSTSLVAVHLACQGLISGDCDMALAGGVSLSYPIKQGYQYRNGMIFSKSGQCRPFEAHSDGTVFSDGVGIVVLKRLEDAIRDKDAIYGVIKGTAINNDGNNKAGFTAPSPVGQAQVIRDCLNIADVSVESIQYVEAHGTGTEIGDSLEIKAISQVYGEETDKKNFCAIGSIKSNVGHLNTASGIAGLIKALLVLKHKKIPPMANFNQENEQLNLKYSQFYINRETVPLKKDEIARVAVSSFGIGGTNAHVIIEEAPATKEIDSKKNYYFFPFSAKTQESLFKNMEQITNWLKYKDDSILGNMAMTLQTGRECFAVRKTFVSADKEELLSQLHNASLEGKAKRSVTKPIYFLVTGQGSQYVNMAKNLYENVAKIREIMDQGAELILEKYAIDLLKILYPDEGNYTLSKDLITETEYAQPLIFLVSYALGRYLMSIGIRPDKIIGHSLGEYVGACLADVMSFETGLDIVYWRGKYIQNAQRGKMIAVKASLDRVKELRLNDVFVSVVNAPEAIVLGGDFEAIEGAKKVLEAEGISFQPLQTSHAFHTPIMQEAASNFEKYIRSFPLKDPNITLISNVTAEEIKKGQLSNPKYWREHIVNPVLFSQSITQLLVGEEAIFIEIGSGRTLIDLARQQEQGKNHIFMDLLPNRYYKQNQYEFFLKQLAKLWELGVAIDFEACFGKENYKVHMPTYCFDRQEFSFLDSMVQVAITEEKSSNISKLSFSMNLSREGISTQLVEPRDEVEKVLLELLKENMGINNIGVFDNFFELGLSSLSASQYALLLKEKIDVDIQIKSIIEAGCVAELSEAVTLKLLAVLE